MRRSDSMEAGPNLENTVSVQSRGRTAVADTVGNVTYPLIVASAIDYASGLNLTGIVAARASGIPLNVATGRPYGWWREQVCRLTNTTEKSGRVRKTLADLLAFNTFQVPLYAGLVAFGSYVSEGKIDWEKAKNGATYLAGISPLIGPTMGLYMDLMRRFFGVSSAAKAAEVSKT